MGTMKIYYNKQIDRFNLKSRINKDKTITQSNLIKNIQNEIIFNSLNNNESLSPMYGLNQKSKCSLPNLNSNFNKQVQNVFNKFTGSRTEIGSSLTRKNNNSKSMDI